MLNVRVLGDVALDVDGRPLAAPAGRRARELLGWLALHPGAHARRDLAARIWPDVLDSSARASLRTALHELRSALGEAGHHLVATRERVALEGAWVDARAFEELVADGRLEDALAMDGDELLKGLDEEWVYAARDRHRERVLDVLEQLATAAQDAGDAAGAVRWSREQVARDPLSEQAARQLMTRLAAAGDGAAAMAVYERLRERLRRELAVAPSAQTRALAQRLREPQPEPPPAPATPSPARPQFPAALHRRRAMPFVGRDGELQRLQGFLDDSLRGERRLVLVAGEPGIGKTRLAAELCRAAHAAGATVLFGRCSEEPLAPYEATAEALRALVLRSGAPAQPAELALVVPELAATVAVPASGDRWRLFAAVDGALTAAAQDSPVVVLLDDLHWADKPELLLLSHLARSPQPARLLLLATYRESELGRTHPLAGVLADLRRDGLVERVRLGGLQPSAVGELVAASLGAQAPPDLAAALHDETAGNPFFVGEVLRHLRESGGGGGIPEGVKEVIGRRLSRLSDAANEVLRTAAVAGREIDVAVLEDLDALRAVDVLRALEEAAEAQMLREESPGRYGFAHALIREALYDEVSLSRRVRLHAAIADAIERRYVADLAPHTAELAHHLLEAAAGGTAQRAVEWALRAAQDASARLAYEEAAALYGRALHAAPAAARGRRDLLLARGEALLRAGETAAARVDFRAAALVARDLRDAAALARAALGFSGLTVTIIEVDPEAVALLEEALAAPALDRPLRARLLARLAIEIYYGHDVARRRALGEEAVATARAGGDDAALVDALNALHVAWWSADGLERRFEVAREMVDVAHRLGDLERLIQAHHWLVLDYVERGDLVGADREIAEHERLAQELRMPAYAWWGPVWRAMRATMEGRYADAERLAEEARAVGARADANAELYHAMLHYHLGLERGEVGLLPEGMSLDKIESSPAGPAYRAGYSWILAAQGRDDEAREQLEWVAADGFARLPMDMNWLAALAEMTQACAYLDDADTAAALAQQLEPYANRLILNARAVGSYGVGAYHLGILATVTGDFPAAEAWLEEAAAKHERLGARPLLARTRLAHAAALQVQGKSGAGELLEHVARDARQLRLDDLQRRATAALAGQVLLPHW